MDFAHCQLMIDSIFSTFNSTLLLIRMHTENTTIGMYTMYMYMYMVPAKTETTINIQLISIESM